MLNKEVDFYSIFLQRTVIWSGTNIWQLFFHVCITYAGQKIIQSMILYDVMNIFSAEK